MKLTTFVQQCNNWQISAHLLQSKLLAKPYTRSMWNSQKFYMHTVISNIVSIHNPRHVAISWRKFEHRHVPSSSKCITMRLQNCSSFDKFVVLNTHLIPSNHQYYKIILAGLTKLSKFFQTSKNNFWAYIIA